MKLEMNRAWNDALRLLRLGREVVLIVAGVFFFLPYFAFMIMAPNPLTRPGATPTDPQEVIDRLGEFSSHVWWVLVVIVVLQAVGMLGLLALLTDRRRPTVGEALKTGAARMLPYIASYILVGLALGAAVTILATIAALIGVPALGALVVLAAVAAWVFLFVRFSLVAPVLVKENVASPLTALGQSWRLTRGNGWRLFAFFALLFVAYVVVLMIVSMVLGTLFGLLGSQVGVFGDALVMSLFNAGWATLLMAVLAAVHDQFAGQATARLNETFE
jgi:MFS family permease